MTRGISTRALLVDKAGIRPFHTADCRLTLPPGNGPVEVEVIE